MAPAPTAAAVVSPVPATTRTPPGSPSSAATPGSTVPTTLAGGTSSGSRSTSRPQRAASPASQTHRGRVAVVGAPAQHGGVPAGDGPAGQPHGEVLGHVEQPGRGGIRLGPFVAQPRRLAHGVLAGAGRHAPREREPVPQGPRVVAAGHPQPATGELLGVAAAARVHPGERRVHVPPVRVDGHQPAPLAAHADGGDPSRTRSDAGRAVAGSPPRSLATSRRGPARRRRRAAGAGRPSPSRGRPARRRCRRAPPAGPPVPRSTPSTTSLMGSRPGLRRSRRRGATRRARAAGSRRSRPGTASRANAPSAR